MYSAILPFAILFSVVAADSHSETAGRADVETWTVGNCIVAQFAMEFVIHPNVTDGNQTETVEVPKSAKADNTEKNCQNETQNLILNWQDRAKNGSRQLLDRNLTIVFTLKPNESYYGVSRFFAEFELAHFPTNVSNKSVNAVSKLQIDSKDIKKLMFHTPINRSFLCAAINTVSIPTSLVYSVNPMPKQMNNTLLSAKHVQFDAFRAEKTHSGFRTPMDCNYEPNDIIPIAVGVALAALVVAVLVAYMIGRRRIRQHGYQSV